MERRAAAQRRRISFRSRSSRRAIADELRLELSDRVRKRGVLRVRRVPADVARSRPPGVDPLLLDHPSYNALPQWIRATVNAVVLNERFRRASIDRALVVRLTKQAPIEELGLFERDADGRVKPAEDSRRGARLRRAVAVMTLMYITVMSSAPQLLNSVIEEKMSRISEVLIGSVTPFELMMGKLLGSAAASLLLAAIYIAGGLAGRAVLGRLRQRDHAGHRRLVPAVSDAGAVHLRIAVHRDRRGVQRSEGRAEHDDAGHAAADAAGVHAGSVLRAPDGTMATVLSLFPTAAPFLMLLRIALQPGPPMWQIAALGRRSWRGTVVAVLGRRQDLPHRPADAGQVGDVRRDVEVGQRRSERQVPTAIARWRRSIVTQRCERSSVPAIDVPHATILDAFPP